MKIRLLGVVMALALVAPGSDASAEVTDEARPSLSLTAGTVHGGMTLAKAKKRRRPPGGGGKADAADDAAADDDGAGKGTSAGGDASDDAKEEEIFGAKKKAAPRDDSASADSGAAKEAPKPSAKSGAKSVETVESQASEEAETSSSTSALEFGLGAKALFRNLAWTSDARAPGCSPCLGPYSLTPGPETTAWFEFYPAAFGTSGFAANVGLIGRFDYGFGVATTLANNQVVATKFRDFLGGIKVRIPFGTFIPNVSLAYGQQLFAVARQDPNRDIPPVAYQFIRPALGARMMLTPTVSLDAVLGYLMVLDPGSGANYVKSTFPDATSSGFDVSASVAFRLTGAIGLRAGADLRYYILSLNDKTQPTIGGAVDRYITAWAGMEVVLDGAGAAAGGDDEPAKPSKRKRRHAEPKEDEESQSESEAD